MKYFVFLPLISIMYTYQQDRLHINFNQFLSLHICQIVTLGIITKSVMLFSNGKTAYLWMSTSCVAIRLSYIKYTSPLTQYSRSLKLGARIKDTALLGKRIQHIGGSNLKFKTLCANDLLKCKNNLTY